MVSTPGESSQAWGDLLRVRLGGAGRGENVQVGLHLNQSDNILYCLQGTSSMVWRLGESRNGNTRTEMGKILNKKYFNDR